MFTTPNTARSPGSLACIPNDGYTETGFIKAEPRLYPAVHFAFRPMLVTERASYGRARERFATKEADLRKYMAAEIAAHLVHWDIRDDKGEILPITAESVLRAKAQVFDRLFLIMIGDMASDDDPDAPKAGDELDQEMQDIAEAVKTGRSVREIAEARDLKNSQPASGKS